MSKNRLEIVVLSYTSKTLSDENSKQQEKCVKALEQLSLDLRMADFYIKANNPPLFSHISPVKCIQ